MSQKCPIYRDILIKRWEKKGVSFVFLLWHSLRNYLTTSVSTCSEANAFKTNTVKYLSVSNDDSVIYRKTVTECSYCISMSLKYYMANFYM